MRNLHRPRRSRPRGWSPRPAAIAFFTWIILANGASLQPAADANPPAGFTVLTYNLFVGVRDADANAAAILAGKADIVCLQEATPAWERALRKRLGARYPHIAFRHGKPAGLGILSKFPVTVKKNWRSPAGWPGMFVETKIGDRTVQILVLHLRPPFVDKGGWSLRAFLRWRRSHRAEIRHAMSAVEPTRPLIIAGDFNEADRGVAAKWLEETHGMTNALAVHDKKSHTFRVDLGFTRIYTRLDHIFLSRHFHPTAARVIKGGRSDHYPVVADVQWTEETTKR